MSEVVSTAFYLPIEIRGSTRSDILAAFVQDLICYDVVWVLTDQLAAVGPLIAEMGIRSLREAIDSGVLKFVHDRQVLGWPQRAGYFGPVPVMPLVSIPQPGHQGYTQIEGRKIAEQLALKMGVGSGDARALANAVERATLDFGGLPEPEVPIGHSSFTEGLIQQVEAYEAALMSIGDSQLTVRDLQRLKRDLGHPRRTPLRTKTIRVMRTHTAPGWEALDLGGASIAGKQAVLLRLFLADRALAVHAHVSSATTLHADQAVEDVLAARLNQIRRAAGAELNDLLHAEELALPTVMSAERIDYGALLKARDTNAGRQFRRRVVDVRDKTESLELLQAYHRSLKDRIGDRFSTKIGRLIVTTLAGVVPGVGVGASAIDSLLIDKLLAGREPSFFINDTLRRLSTVPGGSKGKG
jgi:hypothetical protein